MPRSCASRYTFTMFSCSEFLISEFLSKCAAPGESRLSKRDPALMIIESEEADPKLSLVAMVIPLEAFETVFLILGESKGCSPARMYSEVVGRSVDARRINLNIWIFSKRKKVGLLIYAYFDCTISLKYC